MWWNFEAKAKRRLQGFSSEGDSYCIRCLATIMVNIFNNLN